jgi:hypothetical protein
MRTWWHCELRALSLPYLKNTLSVHKDTVRPSPVSVVARFAGYVDAVHGAHDSSNLLWKKWEFYFSARCVATERPESPSV